MSDQGTPARDTETDKDLDENYDVSEQNHEEQPDGAKPSGTKDADPDGDEG